MAVTSPGVVIGAVVAVVANEWMKRITRRPLFNKGVVGLQTDTNAHIHYSSGEDTLTERVGLSEVQYRESLRTVHCDNLQPSNKMQTWASGRGHHNYLWELRQMTPSTAKNCTAAFDAPKFLIKGHRLSLMLAIMFVRGRGKDKPLSVLKKITPTFLTLTPQRIVTHSFTKLWIKGLLSRQSESDAHLFDTTVFSFFFQYNLQKQRNDDHSRNWHTKTNITILVISQKYFSLEKKQQTL